MNKTILKDIKDTEKKAEKLVAAAEKQAEKIVRKAKQDALTLISEKQDALDKHRDSKIKEVEQDTLKEKDRILKQGAKDVKNISQQATKNVQKAVTYILKKFDDYLAQ